MAIFARTLVQSRRCVRCWWCRVFVVRVRGRGEEESDEVGGGRSNPKHEAGRSAVRLEVPMRASATVTTHPKVGPVALQSLTSKRQIGRRGQPRSYPADERAGVANWKVNCASVLGCTACSRTARRAKGIRLDNAANVAVRDNCEVLFPPVPGSARKSRHRDYSRSGAHASR